MKRLGLNIGMTLSERIVHQFRRVSEVGVKMVFGSDAPEWPDNGRAQMALYYLDVWPAAGVSPAHILGAIATSLRDIAGDASRDEGQQGVRTNGQENMVVAVLHHFVKPGMVEAAERRIDANGNRMATRPGFLFRHAMISYGDPCKLVTLTAWQSHRHYEGWCDSQSTEANSPPTGSEEQSPYVRVETEVLTVRRSHFNSPI